MARTAARESGITLGRIKTWGAAVPRLAYVARRAGVASAAGAALTLGLAASWAAATGEPDPGVLSEPPGGTIVAISPIGFAWHDGIRVGQTVIAVSPADDPAGWRLETTDGTDRFTTMARPARDALRSSLALGLAALVCGGLAVLFLRGRRAWVLAWSSLALTTASVPLELSGDGQLSTLAMAGAVLVPGLWVSARLPMAALRVAGTVGLAVLLGAWTTTRLSGSPDFEALETLRDGAALLAGALLIGDRLVLPGLARRLARGTRPTVTELVEAAVFAGVCLGILAFTHTNPLWLGALLAMGLAVVPPVRRRFGARLERTLLADMRAAAAAEGAEEVRAHLARELHDVPLQELTGVIRRLEVIPGAMPESDELRGVASRLRSLAVDLRPPVLDDLGLPAALHYLADEASTPALPVVAQIDDETGFGPERRPPAVVELAAFRIAGEAVTNAIRHAGARTITLRGRVNPGQIELVIADDGAGLDAGKLREAARQQRLGLASMRHRAQAIDAEFGISSTEHGTEIRLVWRA